MDRTEIAVLDDPVALAHEAARRFVWAAQAAAARGRFSVALAGGSTPAGLYRLLATAPYREQVDWGKTLIFFGDERCVPPDHSDSNYRMARETLLEHVPLPAANVYRIEATLPPDEASRAYEAAVRAALAPAPRASANHLPVLDLILLGIGEDGHTASLFPGMPALDEQTRLVVASEVPPYARPAVRRVTMTLPLLNAARSVMFLVAGANKAAAVSAALAGPAPTHPAPARRVRPSAGTLVWLLDRAARGGPGGQGLATHQQD